MDNKAITGKSKLEVLLLINAYLPGFKFGGPIRSAAKMIELLSDEFHFRVLTADRDAGGDPYPGIEPLTWYPVGGAEVCYCSKGNLSFRTLGRIIRQIPHDVLYLNSFFNPIFTVAPLLLAKFGFIPKRPTVLAPRGELSPPALRIKWPKKKAYLYFSKAIKLYDSVLWQASNALEQEHICNYFSQQANIMIAPHVQIPHDSNSSVFPLRPAKAKNHLRVIFLSRIAPIKNLEGALRILEGVKGRIVFNIYGPLENAAYWEKCQKIMGQMPANIRVEYKGSLPNNKVHEIMSGHDLFFLPTFSESYGNVIMEALLAGCPVLISDQTPWKGLERQGIGWEIPISSTHKFRQILEHCIAMDPQHHYEMCRSAWEYGSRKTKDDTAIAQNKALLISAAMRRSAKNTN